jgi:peptidoglycan/LPS O-acetylase OafA/YrhL
MSNNKFYSLEILRFLATFSVVLWHYDHFFVAGVWNEQFVNSFDKSSMPLHGFLSVFYDRGFWAVQVFWMLSGFIFFWKYSDTVHRKLIGSWTFFVLRFSRLYPLHIATLLATFGLQYAYFNLRGTPYIYDHNDASHFVLQIFMASNWFSFQPQTFDGPIWSVSAEVLIYAIFFAIVSFVRPTALMSVVIVLLDWAATKVHALSSISPVINCMMFFFVGGFIQRALVLDGGKKRLAFYMSSVICLGLATALSTGIIPFSQKAFGCLAALIILASVTGESEFGSSIFDFGKNLGNLTYSTYLLHFPVQLVFVLMVDQIGIGRAVFFRPEMMILYVTVCFCLGHFVYRLLELPSQSFIRRRLLRTAQPRLA